MVYDATADLYVDGRKIEGDTKDTRLGKTLYPRRYFIKEDAKILAITVNRSPGKVRFMVTSNFGVHSSDGQWKCTTRFSHYWFLPPFDDSDWPPPNVIPDTQGVDDMPYNSKWVVPSTDVSAEKVYCRRRIGEFELLLLCNR